jgi:hypothetical protein
MISSTIIIQSSPEACASHNLAPNIKVVCRPAIGNEIGLQFENRRINETLKAYGL